MALRGMLLLAALTVLPSLFGDARRADSPYLSTLSQIPSAYAQVQCNNKGCVSGGHRHSNCGRLDGFYCYKYNGSSCSTGQC
jgi:hypothetical protein